MSTFPEIRMRRYRRTESLRRLFDQPLPGPSKWIWPVFVIEGKKKREAIPSMPGQFRLSVDELIKDLEPVAKAGIGGVLLFGQVDAELKDAKGSAAHNDRLAVQRAVREIKKRYPSLVVMTDVCLCAYTSHGHCGPLAKCGDVDNDASLEMLRRVAQSHAAAGADIVAPSAMMDGQVMAIRDALDDAGFNQTLIMSYSSKFASAMYGPFRDAEKSAPQQGNRRGYQASYSADVRQALRESSLDEAEGADILMVKPALFYLDVIAKLRERTDLPIAAYNVSGEYSMLCAAAAAGYGDLRGMVRESIAAMARAGTDLLLTYWAGRYAEIMED